MGDMLKVRKLEGIDKLKKDIYYYTIEHRVRLETPKSVFITFETEQGAKIALKSNEKLKEVNILPQQKFGQTGFNFLKAAMPSDIIWEN
jgi:hypothetical protein